MFDVFSQKNRILLRELIKTDFKLRYQGSAIGYLWSILKAPDDFYDHVYCLHPILTLGWRCAPFPSCPLVGQCNLGLLLRSNIYGGWVSIVSRGDLLRKLNFSKHIIVLSAISGAAINFVINLVVVLIFSFFNGVTFSWTALMVIPLFFELFLMATGCALILATFFVRFRDLGQVWEVLLQAGLYATPIIYPITFIADRNPWAAKLVMMNPLAQIIQDMRYFLIDKANTPVWLLVENKFLVLIPYVLPILIFVAGFAYFNKHAKKFAEIL